MLLIGIFVIPNAEAGNFGPKTKQQTEMDSLRANWYRDKAKEYIHNNQHDEAITTLTLAIEMDPYDMAALYAQRAREYDIIGKTDLATKDRDVWNYLVERGRKRDKERGFYDFDYFIPIALLLPLLPLLALLAIIGAIRLVYWVIKRIIAKVHNKNKR